LKHPKAAVTLMSILQATYNYSVTHNIFKTFKTRSQQVYL